MKPTTYHRLRLLIQPFYVPRTRLDFDHCLALFLYFVAHSVTYAELVYEFEVSGAVCRAVVEQFMSIILQALWHDYVVWPRVSFEMARDQRLRKSEPSMRELNECFDRGVALIDGTHFPCERHGKDEKMRNRHSNMTVNMVIVTDLMSRICAIAPGLGSEHNSLIFRNRFVKLYILLLMLALA